MKKTDNLADKICLIAAAVLLVYQTLTAIFPGIESLLFGWVSDPLKLHFAGITLLIIPIFVLIMTSVYLLSVGMYIHHN